MMCRNPSLMRAGFHTFNWNFGWKVEVMQGRNPSLMRAGFHLEEWAKE